MKKRRISRRTSFEYGDDRARDLLKVFKREFEICDCLGMVDVLKIVVECPAERFWVSGSHGMAAKLPVFGSPSPTFTLMLP